MHANLPQLAIVQSNIGCGFDANTVRNESIDTHIPAVHCRFFLQFDFLSRAIKPLPSAFHPRMTFDSIFAPDARNTFRARCVLC